MSAAATPVAQPEPQARRTASRRTFWNRFRRNRAGVIGVFVLVVFSVLFFDKIKIDDPVGAISVHGVCGMWGVLSVGLFAKYDDAFLGREDAGLFYGGGVDQLAMQAVMILIIAAWVGVASFIVFSIVKATIGIRVSAEEEIEGLDVLEHGLQGYAPDMSHT